MNQRIIGRLLVVCALVLLGILVFVKMDVDEQSAVLCQTYEKAQLDMETCPAHQSNVSWMVLAAFGLGVALLGIGLYLLFVEKGSSVVVEPVFREVDVSKLDDEERKVYDLLKAKKGSAYQSDVMKETGFSKVKVSRILDRLETKEIIERKRRGMTNLVVLQ